MFFNKLSLTKDHSVRSNDSQLINSTWKITQKQRTWGTFLDISMAAWQHTTSYIQTCRKTHGWPTSFNRLYLRKKANGMWQDIITFIMRIQHVTYGGLFYKNMINFMHSWNKYLSLLLLLQCCILTVYYGSMMLQYINLQMYTNIVHSLIFISKSWYQVRVCICI